jgi:hypothetical protein
MNVEQTVCPFNGRFVMTPHSIEPGLICHFSFDQEISLDLSGNKHFLHSPPQVGPENGGKGYSGYYDGNS